MNSNDDNNSNNKSIMNNDKNEINNTIINNNISDSNGTSTNNKNSSNNTSSNANHSVGAILEIATPVSTTSRSSSVNQVMDKAQEKDIHNLLNEPSSDMKIKSTDNTPLINSNTVSTNMINQVTMKEIIDNSGIEKVDMIYDADSASVGSINSEKENDNKKNLKKSKKEVICQDDICFTIVPLARSVAEYCVPLMQVRFCGQTNSEERVS